MFLTELISPPKTPKLIKFNAKEVVGFGEGNLHRAKQMAEACGGFLKGRKFPEFPENSLKSRIRSWIFQRCLPAAAVLPRETPGKTFPWLPPCLALGVLAQTKLQAQLFSGFR